jgi:hypothetical protein
MYHVLHIFPLHCSKFGGEDARVNLYSMYNREPRRNSNNLRKIKLLLDKRRNVVDQGGTVI